MSMNPTCPGGPAQKGDLSPPSFSSVFVFHLCTFPISASRFFPRPPNWRILNAWEWEWNSDEGREREAEEGAAAADEPRGSEATGGERWPWWRREEDREWRVIITQPELRATGRRARPRRKKRQLPHWRAASALAYQRAYYHAGLSPVAPGILPGAIPEVYGGVGGAVAPGAVGWGAGVRPMGVMGPTNAEIAINAKQTVNGITTRQFSRREFHDPFDGFMRRRRRRRRWRRRMGGPMWNGMFWG